MGIVPCKCSNCGGILNVDNSKDAVICEYCGMPFVVEKAINNYNIKNDINAEIVNIYNTSSYDSSDYIISAGILEKYVGASINVVIPDGVVKISNTAFTGCKYIKSVTIPRSVEYIEAEAFYTCTGLKEVHTTDLKAWCNIYFEFNPLTRAKKLYLNDELITDLVIPGGVQKISHMAFSDCTSLKTITIPESVKEIGAAAFYGCKNIKNVSIPKSITKIENQVFADCSKLKCVDLPDEIESIGNSAFENCFALESISIPKHTISIGDSAFENCTFLKNVVLPEGIKNIGNRVFKKCVSITSFTIPDSIESIGNDIFKECKNLKSINASERTKKILNKNKLNSKQILSIVLGLVLMLVSFAFIGENDNLMIATMLTGIIFVLSPCVLSLINTYKLSNTKNKKIMILIFGGIVAFCIFGVILNKNGIGPIGAILIAAGIALIIFMGKEFVKSTSCPKCGKKFAMLEISRIIIDERHFTRDVKHFIKDNNRKIVGSYMQTVPVTEYICKCIDECKYCGYQQEIKRTYEEQ